MAMLDIKSLMHSRIDEMFATISGQASDGDCQHALKRYLMSNYSDLASLSFWLGCNAEVFQREAVPAADLVDDAYFEIMREREFEYPAVRPQYSTINSRQQFGAVVEGASL
ncbi:hypothetical protein RWA06_04715 [Sinorhizobium meliloti]|uniref:hypothetical protein n=1 Tax=Rhizobium meliloti TaxID=382 RepID=UPI00299E2E7D|nr:hypothetical protein [Sinorhizobium meliloti]